ncbi:PA14 domain-containing protein [Oxalobacteraceae bacterium OTU3CINTB1]|nr:PA14 domain-containing protein [Oxalobacteraceae bacterium OTU3CINTB1]
MKRYAIVLVILLHLALGAFLMLSRLRPALKPEPRTVEVVLFEVKVPEKKIPEAVPEPRKVDPPPVQVPALPELPPVKVADIPVAPPSVAQAIPAPVVVAPPPPPPPPPPEVKAAATPPKVFEECADSPDRNMVADVYNLRTGTQSVTEMRHRKPVKRVCLAQLNIAPRDFREGFPGLGTTNEWFGLDIRFTVNVAEAGTWELMLLSDDGAILSIDDQDVINNDGIHGALPETAKVKLEKGLRNFRVRYFQGPGFNLALILGWRKPGAADFDYLPRKLIGRPPAGTLAALLPKE